MFLYCIIFQNFTNQLANILQLSFNTNVLIVGAGPTGLMMAAQLNRFGIECIIIDKKNGTTIESRALGVQARTLEIYEQMGIVDKALSEGERLHKINIIIKGKLAETVKIGEIGTGISNYPFVFILEQNKNENLLYNYLNGHGVDVKWNTELQQLHQHKDSVQAVCKNGEGEMIIDAKWLVSADGARSTVRHLLNLKFDGGTYENIFYVADTATDWPWGHDGLSLCLSKETFLGLFPMQGANRYRLIGVLPKGFDPEVKHFEEIEGTVKKLSSVQNYFYDTKWFSVYKVHHRSVRLFRSKRIFFAGDSAHVHSPAGAQGMNTGLQDAYNLGWKLAFAIRAGKDTILDSYHKERKPVANRLLRTTDRAFTFVTSKNKAAQMMRLMVIPRMLRYFLRFSRFRYFIFRTFSQTGIHYQSSLLSHTTRQATVIRAGVLIPRCFVNDQPVYESLVFNGFTFLCFNWYYNDNQKEQLRKVTVLPVQFVELKKTGNEEAFKKFKVQARAVFIIRPDNYIGLASDNITMAETLNYFNTLKTGKV